MSVVSAINSVGKAVRARLIEECLEQLGDEVERLCNEEQVESEGSGGRYSVGKAVRARLIEECLEQLGDEVERLCNEEQVERMNLHLPPEPSLSTCSSLHSLSTSSPSCSRHSSINLALTAFPTLST
ncbi:hypothetical protein EMCRGX_G021643 [Ephydatia muelleri]